MGIDISNFSRPQVDPSEISGAFAPVLSKLLVGGHSIASGSSPLQNAANRITTKLAQQIGATETNVAAATSGMLAADFATTPPSKLSQGNNWPHFCQNYQPARAVGPYLASTIITEIMWGINDIAQYGPANAAFLADWKSVVFALCCFMRSGAYKPYTDGSIAYGGSGSWTGFATTTQSPGTGTQFNPTNGCTETITLPSDYDGQAVDLFFLTGGDTTPCASATYTVTVGGVQVAQQSSLGINVAANGAAFQTQLYCIRLPGGTTNLAAGATIVVTFSNIVGNAFAAGWSIESSPAPFVILADVLRSPAGYSAYAAWPYTPTDADVIAVNAANLAVAAQFPDGVVICDGADAAINKIGNSWDWINVHPMARIAGQIASLQRAKLLAACTNSVISTLGMLGSS